jgi:hypothetical protein
MDTKELLKGCGLTLMGTVSRGDGGKLLWQGHMGPHEWSYDDVLALGEGHHTHFEPAGPRELK